MNDTVEASDILIFSEGIRRFFAASTGSAAEVRTAYLVKDAPSNPGDLYCGVIPVSGGFTGHVDFLAPKGLLTHVLLRLGESDFGEESHRDLVGEIANQIAGYARRVFGEQMRIAPPEVHRGQPRADTAALVYALPMRWESYEALLYVRLEPQRTKLDSGSR